MADKTRHGVYVGNDPALLTQFDEFIGKPADHVLMYLNDRSWSEFDSSIGWAADLWQDSPTPRVWGVPLTVVGTPLEAVATGAYNGTFLKAAQALAQSKPLDDGNIYVRVGWEFNGDWMPWAAEGHEQAFIGAFHQLVDTFRSVSDKFKFVWDVNASGTYDPSLAYPGDDYVDVIGMDTYWNKQWDSHDPVAAFETKVTQPVGLQWLVDFAEARGKPMAISEWGVQTDDGGPFIAAMAAWMAEHNVILDTYWQTNLAEFDGDLRQHPNAAEAYRQAFVVGEGDGRPIDSPDPIVPVPADPVDEAPCPNAPEPVDPIDAGPGTPAPADPIGVTPSPGAGPPASPPPLPPAPCWGGGGGSGGGGWTGGGSAGPPGAAPPAGGTSGTIGTPAHDIISLLLSRFDGQKTHVLAEIDIRIFGSAGLNGNRPVDAADTAWRGIDRPAPGAGQDAGQWQPRWFDHAAAGSKSVDVSLEPPGVLKGLLGHHHDGFTV